MDIFIEIFTALQVNIPEAKNFFYGQQRDPVDNRRTDLKCSLKMSM